MKELTVFYFPECPYCKQAFKWHEEILKEHPEYKDIKLKLVDEHKEPEYADTFDYWYVPAYFVNGEKLCEGAKERKLVERAFRKAYES